MLARAGIGDTVIISHGTTGHGIMDPGITAVVISICYGEITDLDSAAHGMAAGEVITGIIAGTPVHPGITAVAVSICPGEIITRASLHSAVAGSRDPDRRYQ